MKVRPKYIERKYIQRGIEKYHAHTNENLNRLIKAQGLSFESYSFSDGRILLILPDNLGGLLYDQIEEVYNML